VNGFKPYKRRPAHSDVALVHFDQGSLWIEQEAYPYRSLQFSDVPDDAVIYAERDTIRALLRAGLGEATLRETSIVKWECDGRTILPLARDVEVTLDDLCLWREWLESEGAGIGSRSGAAVKLLRATLQREFSYTGEWPNVESIVGGRLHKTNPAMHPEIKVWDLRAAYATTLASLPSGYWKHNGDDVENEEATCFALATIYVPGKGMFGPLPQRDGIHTGGAWWEEWIIERPYPQRVTITGVWSGDEIRSALNAGARIEKIHRSWFLRVEDYPFQPWWEAVERGRKMNGAAGSLAKITGNTLWGIFGTREGPMHKLRYVDGKQVRTPLPEAKIFHRNYPLAELITSKVRARIYNELIVPAGRQLISVCVDGGLTTPGFTPQGADWRLKDSGKLCSFLSPYLLMYLKHDGTPVYKAAGIPTAKRASFFRSLQEFAMRHGKASLKIRHALDGGALDMALATGAVEEAFQ